MKIAKNKFHISFFHSYLKNGILAGIHAAHICLSDELIPKDLLPMIRSTGTVKPISGPATYQGQGCFIISINDINIYFFFFKVEIPNGKYKGQKLMKLVSAKITANMPSMIAIKPLIVPVK